MIIPTSTPFAAIAAPNDVFVGTDGLTLYQKFSGTPPTGVNCINLGTGAATLVDGTRSFMVCVGASLSI
jgi:hypothetical protein